MAVDSLSGNVYYGTRPSVVAAGITVFHPKNPDRRAHIVKTIGGVYSINVDSMARFLFYSTTTQFWYHSIIRTNLDGTRPAVLVGMSSFNPATVAIDVETRRVYWLDPSKYELHWVSYNLDKNQSIRGINSADSYTDDTNSDDSDGDDSGSNHNDGGHSDNDSNGIAIVVKLPISSRPLFSLAVRSGSIFWSDNKGIKQVIRGSDGDFNVVTIDSIPVASQLYLYKNETYPESKCLKDSGGCEQLCFPETCSNSQKCDDNASKCGCADGYVIDTANPTKCLIQQLTLENVNHLSLCVNIRKPVSLAKKFVIKKWDCYDGSDEDIRDVCGG
ncbi:hypothetical protein KIN20_035935 [Parelaphostrongylus tenuis]|uniref:Vitellogenin receptor n=1 Tax=Parelaphostrongylus tenuis TaxID=148309 RepID=A0AAD5WK31_PARTN|nr:hypothetical protein KIN20_035935 [Parelaphostrongylus tenuis]